MRHGVAAQLREAIPELGKHFSALDDAAYDTLLKSVIEA